MRSRTKAILVCADVPVERWQALGLGEADVVIPAFYAPPETEGDLRAAGARRVVSPNAGLVSGLAEERSAAFLHASALVDDMPMYRDIAPLRGQETTIASALATESLAGRFLRCIADEIGSADVHVIGGSEMVRTLERRTASEGSPVLLHLPPAGRQQRWSARRTRSIISLAREIRVTRDFGRLWSLPLEVADKRFLLRSRLPRSKTPGRGGQWAYSSYRNYTSSLSAHDETAGASWLVNGRDPATQIASGAPRWNLWELGDPSSRRDHLHIERSVREYSSELAPVARDVIDHLADTALPNILAEIDCLHAFLDAVGPEELWVANQWGSEATALQAAKLRGVPSVQVQHGVMEEYYGDASLQSDRFLVWGDAWKEVLPVAERDRVEVRDPRPDRPVSSTPAGQAVTFFSQPFTSVDQVNPSVYRREAVRLLAMIAARGSSAIVRVHPRDSADAWRGAIARWARGIPIELSAGGGLEDLFRRSTAAVTVSSTVLLDCLQQGIPVVGLDCYPVAWRQMLGAEGALSFAGSTTEAAASASDATRVDPANFARLLASLAPQVAAE